MFEIIILSVVIGLFMHLAYMDFWHLKLPNISIFILTLISFLYVWLSPEMHWQSSLLAGLLLFVLGVGLWLVKLMGAGDAKLMLPLGMLIGLSGYMAFAVALMLYTIVLYVLIKAMAHSVSDKAIVKRFSDIAKQGQVPYGLPLLMAALTVLVVN